MTIKPLKGEDKPATKQRYFHELLESREAIVAKALDRYDNLSDMVGVLSDEAVIKNIKETEDLLLPILKEAKEKWVDLSDVLFIMRENIYKLLAVLSYIYIDGKNN